MSYFLHLLKRVLVFFLDTLQTFVLALAVFVMIYHFAAQPHQVNGNSMEPSFYNSELILVDRISYRFGKPQRGDVVVFQFPLNPELDYIKRIIALPGETIKIENGQIFINGKKLQENYLPARIATAPQTIFSNGLEYKVSDQNFIVMGDNRVRSSDSREWGPVPAKNILGKAFFRYWPLDRLGSIKHADYN